RRISGVRPIACKIMSYFIADSPSENRGAKPISRAGPIYEIQRKRSNLKYAGPKRLVRGESGGDVQATDERGTRSRGRNHAVDPKASSGVADIGGILVRRGDLDAQRL